MLCMGKSEFISDGDEGVVSIRSHEMPQFCAGQLRDNSFNPNRAPQLPHLQRLALIMTLDFSEISNTSEFLGCSEPEKNIAAIINLSPHC